jgi:hypothetical protein
MTAKKRIVLIGLEPQLADFSNHPGLTPEKLMARLNADVTKLNAEGYDAQLCLVDLGETAGKVVERKLKENTFDCIMIGAGVRTYPNHFLLFEQLVNLAHEHGPTAKICFNTKPDDTAEAVRRWI